jgi:hypothetical protein
MVKITDEQARLIATFGQQSTLMLGAAARDIGQATGMPNEADYFNATLITLLETVVFMSLIGTYDTHPERRQALETMHQSLKKLLIEHYRNHHHKGPTNADPRHH